MHALTAIHEPTHHGQIFEIFMNFGSAPENCQKASEQTMTIIRLYGALILAQSWLVWRTRMVADPFVVRWFLRMWLACVHICMYVCMYVCMYAYAYDTLVAYVTPGQTVAHFRLSF